MHFNNLLVVILLSGLVACSQKPISPSATLPIPPSPTAELATSLPKATSTLLPSPSPARLLTICLGREPTSLFYYDATSTSARDILAAVYDGPVDIRNYTATPVILQKLPSLADGDAKLEAVQVSPGDLIVDSTGNVVNLQAGVDYRPSGCKDVSCAQKYAGDQPVQMDQWIMDFKMLSGIQWSDGTPLTASDSLYSYEIARSLYPTAQPELVLRTQSYKVVDDSTIEWIGIPGYQDGLYYSKFFTPLPQHVWHTYPLEELRSTDVSTRKPLGWGAYIIDEWIAGDHISLHKNPLYFRAGEGLPYFDNLVFRFVADTNEALDALQAGECDLIDQTAMLDPQSSRLSTLLSTGQAQAIYQADAGWELLAFGITPLDNTRIAYFANKDVRQAVGLCIDRNALVKDQPLGTQLLADSYVPSTHPLYNPDVHHYSVDVQQASTLLEAAGWKDTDSNPSTPRIAQGVSGVPDGTSFEVDYLVSTDATAKGTAEAIQADLAQCGIAANIVSQPPTEYLAPGPDGPVFGRAFDLAQYAWTASLEPPCNLYLTSEIPGPYPEYPKGWGGVNASGFSNPQYDQACENALYSLADEAQHQSAHFQAQEIYSTELPSLPLYLHYNVSVANPDLCNYTSGSALDSPLWNLEMLKSGSGCSP